MVVGLNLLSYIRGKVLDASNGQKTVFSSGEEINRYYTEAAEKYALARIRAEDGMVAVDMVEVDGDLED